jgi:hypothetical protein
VAAIYRALEFRYDYYSARTIFKEALTWSGLEEKKSYEPKEIKAISAAVKSMGNRPEAAVDALKALMADDTPAPAKSARAPSEVSVAEEEAAAAAEEGPKEADAPVKEAAKKSTKSKKSAAKKK